MRRAVYGPRESRSQKDQQKDHLVDAFLYTNSLYRSHMFSASFFS